MAVPSQSVLSQLRMIVDCGLMMSLRDIFKQEVTPQEAEIPAAYYFFSDSSPQGHVNWQITSYDVLLGSNVQKLSDASRQL
eukprot:7351590-Lingulodinium_polyedra.AAC.1